jgi:hypothetical protein
LGVVFGSELTGIFGSEPGGLDGGCGEDCDEEEVELHDGVVNGGRERKRREATDATDAR